VEHLVVFSAVFVTVSVVFSTNSSEGSVSSFSPKRRSISGKIEAPPNKNATILEIRPSLRKIKMEGRKVKVCFLTSVSDFSPYIAIYPDIMDTVEKNGDRIIEKPIGSRQLVSREKLHSALMVSGQYSEGQRNYS
jgi:hypothetical protein